MIVLFQDFDGVLNSEEFLRKWQLDHPDKSIKDFMNEFYYSNGFDGYLVPDKVKMFNEFIYSNDIKIVCSSSWRIGFSLEHMRHLYKDRGLPYDRLIDLTPVLKSNSFSSTRSSEIYLYLKEHSLYDVISMSLDDDYVESFEDFPRFKPIETIFEYGLERHHIEEMKEWIEEQHK